LWFPNKFFRGKIMSYAQTSKPWWSYGHVWLVISGPLLVVVASVVSGYVAFQGNDTVLLAKDEAALSAQRAMQSSNDRNLVPAVQARNHAATPQGTALKKLP
jgi:hypothetical protein